MPSGTPIVPSENTGVKGFWMGHPKSYHLGPPTPKAKSYHLLCLPAVVQHRDRVAVMDSDDLTREVCECWGSGEEEQPNSTGEEAGHQNSRHNYFFWGALATIRSLILS
jgi:hypothetical protein